MSGRTLPDWGRLGFGLVETDVIYRALGDRRRDPAWEEGRFLPFGDVPVSPAAAFMSYGQGVFEGLKALRSPDGRLLLFRPRDNARRFGRSAERLGLLPFPETRFVRAVEELVRRNARFVPPAGSGSFYVRPTLLAVEPRLGLGPSDRFAVTIYGSPVGPYFREGARRGLRVRVLEQGRCAPGGTGAAKAIGNYAGAIPLAASWKARGFDDVLFLDARHVRYVTETCGSNIFAVLGSGTLVTPPLDDQILPGITRDSVLRIARESLGLDVEERRLPVEELLDDGRELFGTGTAYTIQSVHEIAYRDRNRTFPSTATRDALFEILHAIQSGTREDPFGWVEEL